MTSKSKSELRETGKAIASAAEKNFNTVVMQFENGELVKKIDASGWCEYVFERYANRKCEREAGHGGPHMFGISPALRDLRSKADGLETIHKLVNS